MIDKNILVDIFNCGSGKSYKLSKIYNIISKELKSKISYETDSDIKDKTVMYANIQKTKKYFNWYPKLSINSGIRKVIDEKIEAVLYVILNLLKTSSEQNNSHYFSEYYKKLLKCYNDKNNNKISQKFIKL